MWKTCTALCLGLILAGCGSGREGVSSARSAAYGAAPFATGPISQACLRSDRRAASRARCGCVQAVANRYLSEADQRRGASYFSDPQRLQDVRQSDLASNERFWARWKAYGAAAGQMCT